MPLVVRQECSLFALLALALFFISQSLGSYMTTAYRLSSSQLTLMAGMFYSGVLGYALFSSFLSSPLSARARGFLSPLPLLMTACVLLIFTGHVLVKDNLLAFALRSGVLGILWFAALHAFFLFASPGRKGLFLGLAIAAGELIWITVLPGMAAMYSDAPDLALIRHLHKLQISVQCAGGLLLARVFAIRQLPPDLPQAGTPSVDRSSVPASVLLGLFVAAALFYIAFGLAGKLSFPKATPGISASAHIPLLIAMPLAGALLDRGDRGSRLLLSILALLLFAAPVMVFTTDDQAREALYTLLNVGRQGIFLATMLLAARLARNSKRLPLLIAVPFVLQTTALAGSAISRAAGGAAFEGGIALCLAAAFACLVVRLRRALADADLVRDEDVPPTLEPGLPIPLNASHFAAFGSAYGLSERETLVMELLAQGHSTEGIAAVLDLKESTVRTYVSRLLKKTGADNRVALIMTFTTFFKKNHI